MEPYLNFTLDEKNSFARETLIRTLTNRFNTYGYIKVKTPVFENYHLYTSVQGTIPLNEMVKVISPEGKILVLRPDVTIPISQLASLDNKGIKKEARYSYILDVFRTSFHPNYGYVKTQAGIELLGSQNANADMEVISLAINCLLDLKFTDFKIELGHAGIIQEMLNILSLSTEQEQQLKQLISAKNYTGLEEYLSLINMDSSQLHALQTIPFLYGKPAEVIDEALSLSLSEQMTMKLERLKEVYELLTLYGFGDYIAFDFSLINNMEYYSDIIFQGYIENIGKPILQGGRYDHLSKQFAKPTPAIGFAFDVDALLTSCPAEPAGEQQIYIHFEQEKIEEALALTKSLRELNYRTILSNTAELDNLSYLVSITNLEKKISYQETSQTFTNEQELLLLLQTFKEMEPCNL